MGIIAVGTCLPSVYLMSLGLAIRHFLIAINSLLSLLKFLQGESKAKYEALLWLPVNAMSILRSSNAHNGDKLCWQTNG